MAIITSTLVLRTNALLHFYAAHLLLTEPDALPTQSLVILLGNSMRLSDPSESAFDQASAASALAGLILIFMSLSDVISTFLSASSFSELWGLLSILRGAAYLLTAAWIYMAGKQAPGSFVANPRSNASPGWGAELHNSVAFSWTFIQASVMLWVYVIVKDEQRKEAESKAEEKKAREDRL